MTKSKGNLIILIILLFAGIHCLPQSSNLTDKINQYISDYKNLAISNMVNYGVPASITLAQGILESRTGKSQLAVNANNHFGIKCKSDWKGDTYAYSDDAEDDCFRKYSSSEESYKDHSIFLSTKPRYAFLFTYSNTDYKSWAIGLKEAGYATNPKYPTLLVELIEQYKLSEYDKIGVAMIEELKNKKFNSTSANSMIASSIDFNNMNVNYAISVFPELFTEN